MPYLRKRAKPIHSHPSPVTTAPQMAVIYGSGGQNAKRGTPTIVITRGILGKLLFSNTIPNNIAPMLNSQIATCSTSPKIPPRIGPLGLSVSGAAVASCGIMAASAKTAPINVTVVKNVRKTQITLRHQLP